MCSLRCALSVCDTDVYHSYIMMLLTGEVAANVGEQHRYFGMHGKVQMIAGSMYQATSSTCIVSCLSDLYILYAPS